jgi:hypothetical protein
MFAIAEEHHSEVTGTCSAPQVPCVKINALMNLVRNTLHHADVTADTAFLSLEILSLRLCKSAERV